MVFFLPFFGPQKPLQSPSSTTLEIVWARDCALCNFSSKYALIYCVLKEKTIKYQKMQFFGPRGCFLRLFGCPRRYRPLKAQIYVQTTHLSYICMFMGRNMLFLLNINDFPTFWLFWTPPGPFRPPGSGSRLSTVGARFISSIYMSLEPLGKIWCSIHKNNSPLEINCYLHVLISVSSTMSFC